MEFENLFFGEGVLVVVWILQVVLAQVVLLVRLRVRLYVCPRFSARVALVF